MSRCRISASTNMNESMHSRFHTLVSKTKSHRLPRIKFAAHSSDKVLEVLSNEHLLLKGTGGVSVGALYWILGETGADPPTESD